jgi:hypothetical protein
VALGAGEFTSTVRLSDSAKYFRLVRGFPAADFFDSYPAAWQIASVVPGGALKPLWGIIAAKSQGHIVGQGVRNADFVLAHNGQREHRDCVSTVDVVDWGDAMEDATFGILLRVKPAGDQWFYTTDGLPDQRYAGLLTFKKADNLAESALSITGPGGAVLKEQRFAAVNPDKQYRLRFWAVGDHLTLELFDWDNLDTAIQTITVKDGRIPEGMNALYGTKSAGGTYEVWIDQYLLNATTVY